jgi:hypothetical protein
MKRAGRSGEEHTKPSRNELTVNAERNCNANLGIAVITEHFGRLNLRTMVRVLFAN